MFFYLSFLRPLPHSSDASNYVSITPQIANDLRTSHLDQEIDIFYAWTSESSLADFRINSMARKLTTWRKASMYKNISVPLPPHAKPDQEWRLLLSCDTSTQSFVIDLGANNFGARPFPVLSMPVRLEIRMTKNKPSGKQEQVERLYSIPSRSSEKQSTILCIREQTSFELDKKIWDSGIGLSSWITKLMLSVVPPSNLIIQQLWTFLTRCNPTALRVVELGTGTGIVSICLSTFFEGLRGSQETHVLATDLPSAIELLDHNVSTNKPAYPHVDLQSLVLDWDDDELPPSVQGSIDLIVMADVTYNTASFPSLVRTLDRLVQSSRSTVGGRSPFIILAYKQRDLAERTLWSMLRNIGIQMVVVDKVSGAGGEEVEIWIWNEGRNHKGTHPTVDS